jgi:large subunit ribosomal protein L11
MAKEIQAVVKLQIPGGQANPAPPIGPVLGQQGVNIMEFCKQFNARTQKQAGEVIPVVLTVFKDRSFTFELKVSPMSYLLMQAAKLKKGSAVPNRDKVGKVSSAQVLEIARKKMPDLNTVDEESACSMVRGTARSMGLEVVD